MGRALVIGYRVAADVLRPDSIAHWRAVARNAGAALLWMAVVTGLIGLAISVRLLAFWH